MEGKGYLYDVEKLRSILPHRYPFLLVDRILELEPGKRVVGLKNVTINEPFFNGHFPGQAIMPGVLILESMAQVGGIMMLELSENSNKLAMIAGAEKVRFRKPVLPGDTLIHEVELIWVKVGIGRCKAVSRVNDKIVAEAEIVFALTNHGQK